MSGRPSRPYLLLLPALLLLVLLFGGGLVGAVGQSLAAYDGSSMTLEHYMAVLSSPTFRQEFGLTLYIATAATLLSCAAGLLLAAGLAAAGSRWDLFLARLPLAVPHTVTAYLTILWLSQSGLLARLAHHLGLVTAPADFPALVNDPGAIGILVAYLWKEAPFAALMLYPILLMAVREYTGVAATLGASRLQRWRLVILPLVGPALGATALIIFSYTFGAYEIPYLLGQTIPRTLAAAAVERFNSPDLYDRPAAMVYNLVITALTGLAVWLYLWKLAPRTERRENP